MDLNSKEDFLDYTVKNNHGSGGGNYILVTNVRFFGNDLVGGSQSVFNNNSGGSQFQQPLSWLDGQVSVYSCSSQYDNSSFPASNVLDRNKSYWLSLSGQTTNQWIIFDFSKPMQITKISVQLSNFECSLKDFYLEEGDDAMNWRYIKTFQTQNGTINQNEQFFEGFEIRARYVRIFCYSNWGSGGGDFILINKIRFFGGQIGGTSVGGTSVGGFMQGMTSGNWFDGTVRVFSWSSQHQDSQFVATNLVDSSKTYWLSETGKTTNQWVVFDFGRIVTVTKLSIQVDNWECSAKDFNIEVSNYDDMVSWRYVRGFQAQNGTQNQSEQIFDGFEVRARYIRIFFCNNWGPGGGDYILVKNMRFFGF